MHEAAAATGQLFKSRRAENNMSGFRQSVKLECPDYPLRHKDLVIDTVELGEIRGEHHGTYKGGRFWWWSRGYTPAGCEAWQGIRALDYLETRPEVDKTRFGVTGRSGGGAYSWWIAALDERIKCAAPTAGITTLRNHVVDGCVEGHCDCMFMVNTYR